MLFKWVSDNRVRKKGLRCCPTETQTSRSGGHSIIHMHMFFSKIIEILVVSQLFNYVDTNTSSLLIWVSQGSLYRVPFLRLLSDIYGAIDTMSQVTLLTLCDASAAFVSEDHDLLSRLPLTFGIRDLPLDWITYLSERTASTIFQATHATWRPAPFGLPRILSLGLFSSFSTFSPQPTLSTSCSLDHRISLLLLCHAPKTGL